MCIFVLAYKYPAISGVRRIVRSQYGSVVFRIAKSVYQSEHESRQGPYCFLKV